MLHNVDQDLALERNRQRAFVFMKAISCQIVIEGNLFAYHSLLNP